VVFDFDGVFTDNRVWVAAGGHEWVACSRSDGIGLQALRDLGVPMMVLSTEPNPVVADRCRKLALPCEHGVADKGARLRALLAERNIDAAHVVYVGNDINDLDCLRTVGCPVVVADAHPAVRSVARIVLTERGGLGAVRELCDRLALHLRSTRKETP
jgi:YrbI family 3-deoxy-D-manno-octulosonate 8-phosphate phosphatase